jgi:hypothetical protein
MTTRWGKFYGKQLEDAKMRRLLEREEDLTSSGESCGAQDIAMTWKSSVITDGRRGRRWAKQRG